MARALTVARVRVAPAQQAAWLATLGDLQALERAAGRHLWVFRHPAERDLFLEFSEGDATGHRSAVPAAGAGALEARLHDLGGYAADASVLWEEVPLTPPRNGGS